ncbi:MAG: Rrf2 family transcriptional regulator [Labilithrix sp.]|nr:Rrf2 family transcriptional regulator [Labilithrix sp.]MBX3221630.1 Rrf2 family transcriptional regulator [Labilithrix sp.]
MNASNLLDRKAVAAHVLRHLARAQSRGRLVHLEDLASEIGVRHEDLRHVVTSLHAEGHVDAKRMKLTLSGFALAASMRECKLRDARPRAAAPEYRYNVA